MATSQEGIYLTDGIGNLLAIDRGEKACEAAAACLSGNVVMLGLGLGKLRAALLGLVDAAVITSVRTFESNSDVVATYADIDPIDAALVVVADPSTTVQDKAAESPGHTPSWTSVVVDQIGRAFYDDSAAMDALRALFPDPGGRLVLLSECNDLSVAGFSCLDPKLIEDQYLYVMDRFDPENGIGTHNPHGTIFTPGYGWS